MKKKDKKVINELLEEMRMLNRREPVAAATVDLREAQALQEVIKDDEAFSQLSNTIQRWTEHYVDERIEQLTSDYEKHFTGQKDVLNQAVKQLRQAEMQTYKVKSQIRNEHRELSDAREEIKSLKKDVKDLKTVVRYAGVCNRVAKPGASLKKVKRGYKRALESNPPYTSKAPYGINQICSTQGYIDVVARDV